MRLHETSRMPSAGCKKNYRCPSPSLSPQTERGGSAVYLHRLAVPHTMHRTLVDEQHVHGLEPQQLCPSLFHGPSFCRNIRHDDGYKAIIGGYGDGRAEQYCTGARGRLFGMGVMPITHVDDAIAEMA